MFRLQDLVDCVVMLTWSDWRSEPRSNRYHYGTRFAQHCPVLFVQPDLEEPRYAFESTEVDNLVILHVYRHYGPRQAGLLNQALLARGLLKPLLWMYNCYFVDYVVGRYAPLKIYHATEDYFSPDLDNGEGMPELQEKLARLLAHVDLLVAVSDGILSSYRMRGEYASNALVLGNGCDFDFWSPTADEIEAALTCPDRRVVLYQGGVNSRLDFGLLQSLAESLPDWELWICGRDGDAPSREWAALRSCRNVRSFGNLPPEDLRRLSHQATVGIIPFVQSDQIRVSLPLKAFEYVACGLPVVSVPIDALAIYPALFALAQTSEGFADAIRSTAASRFDRAAIRRRLEVAATRSYDRNFATLVETLDGMAAAPRATAGSLNILVLYDGGSTHVATLREHLESFALFSRHRVFYAIATRDHQLGTRPAVNVELSLFDVVVIHYSVRVSIEEHLAPAVAEALTRFSGLKVLFVQDDYDTTETARRWIERLGIHVVYTVVPVGYREAVYPTARFPRVEFVETLTGYVPIRFEARRETRPIAERKVVIGYRGRRLPFWYGSLGQEKLMIGQRMRQICQEHNIPVDIEWEEDKRIYGDKWYEFLENCKATLGTESGANVFDFDGSLRRSIERALEADPAVSYQEILDRYLAEHEGRIVMNQVSPKLFEAIALRTALVLFEGSYSGVVQPDVHYIPLKKDFSNVDEVLGKLRDDRYLQTLADRAYRDVILSGKYHYRRFIEGFDELVSRRVTLGNGVRLVSGLVGYQAPPGMGEIGRNAYERTLVTSVPHLAARSAAILIPAPTSVPTQFMASALAEAPVGWMAAEIGRRVRRMAGQRLASRPVLFRPARAVYRRILLPCSHLLVSPRKSLRVVKWAVGRRLASFPPLFQLARFIYRQGSGLIHRRVPKA